MPQAYREPLPLLSRMLRGGDWESLV